MKRKNMAAMVTSIALVGAVAVGGTLALLTSQANDLTNTFTVGKSYPDQALELREHDVTREADGDYVTRGEQNWKVDEDGNYVGIDYTDLFETNTVDKDPQFHLKTGSPASWIVAEISGMDKDANTVGNNVLKVTSLADGASGKWYKYDPAAAAEEDAEFADVFTQVTDANQITNGLYIYYDKIAANGTTEPLFDQLTVQKTVDGLTNNNKMYIKGVAVAALADEEYDELQEAAFSAIEAANGVLHPGV